MTKKFIFTIVVYLIIIALRGHAQEPININNLTREDVQNLTYEQLLELPLEELMTIAEKMGVTVDDLLAQKLSISSKSKTTLREQPSIVTVMTEEEIRRSGARDLVDLLRLIPGFNINFDSQGTLGASLRGLWSFEGKLLIMVDGIETNELLYYTTQLGNHYPISQIRRIEIIRGPGSSIYGGSAELGVINIITKTGANINGFGIQSNYGLMTDMFGYRNIDFSTGVKIKDLEVSALAFYGEQNRSQEYYADFYGFAGDLKDTLTRVKNTNINVNVNYKNLKTRFIYDKYNTFAIYGFDESFHEQFEYMTGDMRYEWRLSEKLVVTPRLNYKIAKPWNNPASTSSRIIKRYLGDITTVYDLNKSINLVGGVEFYSDNSRYSDNSLFYNGKTQLNSYNTSFFLQSLIKTKVLNITLGSRYEINSFYGNAFAPRIGVNGIRNHLHFKLLYSRAFRVPSTGNITSCDEYKGYNNGIKPEKTDVAELEVGYRISKNMFATINFFDITINSPIVWYDRWVDSALIDDQWLYEVNYYGYENYGKTGTRGFELDYRLSYDWGTTVFNYSLYSAKHKNEIEAFAVQSDEHSLLGNPRHKLVVYGNYRITHKINLSPSLVYLSKCYGYTQLDDDQNPILNEIDDVLTANIFINFENVLTRGLHVGIGVYDIFNRTYPYVEPYNGYYPPFPGSAREFLLRISYLFKVIE